MIHYEIDTGLPLKLHKCWEILKDRPKFQEIPIPNSNTWSEGGSKRHKLSGSSSFNTESGEASINLNTTVGDNNEDEVQEIRRPEGRDKAKATGRKNKGSKLAGSPNVNEDVLSRLIVTEMTAHEKEEHLVFLDIKMREVECREREIEQQDMRKKTDVALRCKERINNYNGSKDEMSGSVCSGIFKKPVAPQSGGSILCVLEELVKVGQAMGYNMKGLAQKAKKDWVKELCLKNKVNFLALQETKMENMNLWCVKACWGNYTFDYAHSDSVGNSGGILCIWDPNSFQKDNVTVSDFFIIIRGTWLKSGVKILMVAVYAPHDLRDKKILWDYLEYIINRWDGEVLIMGDFNEVRRKTERFGSVFNVQGADMFNTFIANAGLEEIPLGGSSFTWCHKSATKMSKLDRFLISENLFNSYPDICATSLDRFLSDHRPILLRESNHDYGPIPFRYFNHWTELDGFNKFVIDTCHPINNLTSTL
ncbi:RNA-directed DNA polymerase, eukaryota [Tanacetum coccineum]